mmetsp:Transcript_42834/g.107213  ORF Transcript_42834/g.107213 Transcript_42834/m.107213 type:complete len:343 (-) Transcript_42834:433-1461(-)|eukprot:CAMPEP_0173421686 /NCGR_PEP_ID=MMETSP1357-20121228/2704_1 /TAXON_ID=77926 /ORGANISM="Hemiselmis rufescens, Strain PCC563" /LENGTH=342 /DNA_ID=CAMNT_0014384627 /DNA_START=42 /DNA_END=1070 /DNA_ORIENTATION=+
MTKQVPIKELEGLVKRAVRNIGYSDSDADTLTRVMMHAEVHGNNQGISKLYRPQDMGFNPKAGPLAFENETALSVVVNGNQRAGMVALEAAVDKAIDKASKSGMAITGTYNTYTSTGMLAYYANRVAERDFIALVMAGSPEMVAPVGGKQAVFGTNPMCFAVPGPASGPLVLDMATAATTLFGVISTKAAGKELPPGVAVDANGKPTRDPSEALQGAFLAFGGYKGAGLSLIVELLTQALCNGAIPGGAVKAKVGTGRKWAGKSWANTVIVINPSLLMDLGKYKARVAEIVDHVKNSGPTVVLPGEIEKKKRDENLAKGTIPVSQGLYDNINKLASGGPSRL